MNTTIKKVYKCPHNRQKSQCKECAGSSICEHNRIKSTCKECGGSQICEHNRIKSRCKECGGSSICEHKRRKGECKECGGSEICEHNKRKSRCKECDGSSFCEHNKRKSTCKECGGSSICEHNRIKSTCKECGGSSICEHNRIKQSCKDCSLQTYLVNLQRRSLRRLFDNSNIQKIKHTIEYLGCDSEYFMDYMKCKMTPEMNFNNIHIDHIKPVSKFDLDNHDEFLKCCHFTNMQPLLATDNLEKSNKWTAENETFWNDNIIYKEYMEIYK